VQDEASLDGAARAGFLSCGDAMTTASIILQNVRAMPGGSRRLAAAVLVGAVLVTFVFQLTLPSAWRANESADYRAFYEPVARNILAGEGFALGDEPETMYPPGYPVVLAGVFWFSSALGIPESAVLAVVAAFAMGITSVLLYGLARQLWGPQAALLTPLLWMTYPFTLWLTKQPNSEIPFLVALSGACYMFWSAALRHHRGRVPYFLCGVLVGIAMLIRPIAMGVGLVLGVLLWLTRRDLEPRARGLLIGVLLAGNLVAVLPWEVWLAHQTGRVVLLSTNGPASVRDGLTFAVNPRVHREPAKVRAGAARVMRDVMAQSAQLQSLGDIAAVLGVELRTRPLAVADLVALKAARSWYGTDNGRHESAILLIQVAYLIVLMWASRAAWKRGGGARQLTVGVWVLVLYFWAMTVVALSILRYMVPAIGLLFLLTPALIPKRVVHT
jgi:4-amino-4-deoxy-L-arabinose transferase-like glycosyltransferase